MAFTVLVVCTGNICRSPVAERLLRARLDVRWPVHTESAGTSAVVGHGVDGPSARALLEYGVDPRGHVARRLTARLIGGADLILTAETTHRSLVVQADPMAFRRAFTMREFGRLGATVAPVIGAPPSEHELRERVEYIASRRGVVDAPEPGADDISDPFGADLGVARSCVAQISLAVDDVIRGLGDVSPGLQAADG